MERPEWALLNSTSLSVINSTEDGSGFQQVDNSTDNEGNWMVIVSNDADNGYGVDIVIKNVFLDPEYDEYVLIAPGEMHLKLTYCCSLKVHSYLFKAVSFLKIIAYHANLYLQ